MIKDSVFSPTFWMYFSYVLSFIIPLFCGFTLLTVKGAAPGGRAGMHPRRLLGIIFTFSGLIFIPNMIQDIHKYITGELGLPIFDIIINLFLVPLYFFYFRKLTKPEKLTSRRIWPHLIPGILVLITSFFLSPLQEKITGDNVFINVGLPLIIFRCACLILQAAMITIYTLRILHLKRDHMQKLKENYSSMENIDLRWLNQAIPLAVLFAFIALFASCFQAIWSDHLFHISSILFIFYLFIHALNEPYICYTEQHAEIHEEEIIPTNSCPETPIPAPTNEAELSPVFPALPEKYLKNLGIKREKMKDELIRLFDEKEVYTNGNLTITDVAALLGTNRTYVSNVINNEFGFSFYQFVNKYRIQKATILLIQHPDMQIQEVASLSGFNSLSSFISAFKLNEGITPKQWKKRYVDAL
ncbi:MAG TPA: helix-turn-helix domain-containing protein [Butyricimonas virosa]|uniref:Helix-turn-helix domain-containing protein n=1 Tax=Butyricimonas virosa TaxID=544645 RepID=A0A921H499_9BACT|nr:helix-turn-helix domain-containing protein [Butyricimonas virosa]